MAEAAFVVPITAVTILGMVFGGASVYRYQQAAEVAREGARYASVRGGQWAKDNNKALSTPTTVYNNGMKHAAVSFDKSKVSISGNGCTAAPFKFSVVWADAGQMPFYKNASGQKVANTVTVTVSYTLDTGITVSSKSVMPIAY
jgi:hypothetical protein